MKPSHILQQKRALIRQIVAKHHLTNPRIFGSVAGGEDNANSDLDLLVDTLPKTTLFDLGGLQIELEDELGIAVDVCTPKNFPPLSREKILSEAVPL